MAKPDNSDINKPAKLEEYEAENADTVPLDASQLTTSEDGVPAALEAYEALHSDTIPLDAPKFRTSEASMRGTKNSDKAISEDDDVDTLDTLEFDKTPPSTTATDRPSPEKILEIANASFGVTDIALQSETYKRTRLDQIINFSEEDFSALSKTSLDNIVLDIDYFKKNADLALIKRLQTQADNVEYALGLLTADELDAPKTEVSFAVTYDAPAASIVDHGATQSLDPSIIAAMARKNVNEPPNAHVSNEYSATNTYLENVVAESKNLAEKLNRAIDTAPETAAPEVTPMSVASDPEAEKILSECLSYVTASNSDEHETASDYSNQNTASHLDADDEFEYDEVDHDEATPQPDKSQASIRNLAGGAAAAAALGALTFAASKQKSNSHDDNKHPILGDGSETPKAPSPVLKAIAAISGVTTVALAGVAIYRKVTAGRAA